MKELIGVLFVAAAACAPATAQQDNKLSDAASAAAVQTIQVVHIRPEFPPTRFKTEGARRIQRPPEAFVFTQPQWVFKDGALYLDMLGTGTLIPVPGGGASGCFDLNLQERIVRLRSTIEAFPPRPR